MCDICRYRYRSCTSRATDEQDRLGRPWIRRFQSRGNGRLDQEVVCGEVRDGEIEREMADDSILVLKLQRLPNVPS